MDSGFNKDSGRVLVYNGDIYYSPNCPRIVSLPPLNPKLGKEHKLFHLDEDYAEKYHEPLWWTDAFGWIAFLPHNPSYTGPLLKRLTKIPTLLSTRFKKGRPCYVLASKPEDSWLSEAASILASEYNVRVVRPFSSWSFGYTEGHPIHGDALSQIHKAREWFWVWMGLVSYLIAMAESSLPPVDWVTVLSRKHFDMRLLDSLHSSTICDFSNNVVRTGTFLNITAPTAAQPRNAVDALAGLTQAARVLAVDSSVVDPDVVDHSVVKLNDRPPDYIAFFAARDVRNAKWLLTERPGDRQARLDRERKPPVASAKVFEWICHHLTGEWHHEQVLKAERKETLDEYSAAQKWYDSFFNEWDCCQKWGPGPLSSMM
ncbi:hypothetical protein DXG01_009047 [Tephrocybe rancida]|nr:hypothetical protein DXG01_009047 [Tephrocybe rancida]